MCFRKADIDSMDEQLRWDDTCSNFDTEYSLLILQHAGIVDKVTFYAILSMCAAMKVLQFRTAVCSLSSLRALARHVHFATQTFVSNLARPFLEWKL